MEYFAYSQKAFTYKYVVMLSDTDQFKHMSFANYLKLMFLATDALLVSCLTPDFLASIRLKLCNFKMQFKRQTTVGENILIKINASEIGTSKFSLLHTFVIEGSGDLVGLDRQSYEFINKRTQISEPIAGNIRAVLEPIRVNESNLLYKY